MKRTADLVVPGKLSSTGPCPLIVLGTVCSNVKNAEACLIHDFALYQMLSTRVT